MKLITSSDRFAIFGARGMAGGAISRSLQRTGYCHQYKPNRQELNLLDPIEVQKWFDNYRPNVVILAAATVGGISANSNYPADFILENIKIQSHVIEAAWRSGARRLLFLGSSCIYPKFSKQPIKEESLLAGPLEPTNEFYAIAKITGIKLCEALWKQHGFDAISLMPTNLYGPGDNYHKDNSHVLPAMIRRFCEALEHRHESVTCWGTGNPLREFLHVDDLGDASVFALENWSLKPDEPPFLNVGTGIDITIRELAEMVAEAVGFDGMINWDISKPDGTPKKLLDVSRLQQLGWQSRISLSSGLASTIAEYRDKLKLNLVRL